MPAGSGAAPAAPGCFHCGAPVVGAPRWRAPVLGAERDFCCAGCEMVARTIAGAGFSKYYETRSAAGLKPEDLPPLAVYDEPAAQRQFASRTGEHRRSATLILDRIRCAACLWLNEQWLRRLPGLVRVDVNFATRRAQVEWDERETRLSRILEAVRAIGYDAYPFDPRRQGEVEQHARRLALWRLFVAGFAAMQVMMYAVPAYLEQGGTLSAESSQILRWASFALTLPVMLFSCGPFFSSAWRDLRRGRFGLDTPIALGIAAGFGASVWATVTGSGEVYFDSISMLVFLLLAARYAEELARARASRGLDRLLRWMPTLARRLKDGVTAAVPAHELAPGDLVVVPPGERIPADGVVDHGVSSADESLLTGESLPLRKGPGDSLTGGALNLEQPLVMRVTRAGAETTAAAIARLVERAAATRPALVASADRIAHALTYLIVAAAAFAMFGMREPWIAVAVLVVTCPCALALAAPIAQTAAAGQLLERGVAMTRAGALEQLARATDVVIDKTGTLTTGKLVLARTEVLGALDAEACLALARALEAPVRHPIADAIGRGAQASSTAGMTNFPGLGVEGRLEGRKVRIGNVEFCATVAGGPAPAGEARSAAYLADESGWLARFVFEDPLRSDAGELVSSLKAAGLTPHLVSGDDPRMVEALARSLGIGAFAGAATPQDKFAYVERLQGQGRVVAMLGDGLNDAPVLARADASIAMGQGAEIAQLQADFVLLSERLAAFGEARALATRTQGVIRQNFAWALAYNAAALPLALLGAIGPWEAAIGMAASSFVVVLNAVRIAVQNGASWKAASTSWFLSRSRSYS